MPSYTMSFSCVKIKRATLERDFLHTPLSIWRHNSHTARCKSSPRLLASDLCPPQPVFHPSLLNSLLTKKSIKNLILFPYINITACKTLVNLIKFIRYYLCKLICWIIVRKSATKNCWVKRRMLWSRRYLVSGNSWHEVTTNSREPSTVASEIRILRFV